MSQEQIREILDSFIGNIANNPAVEELKTKASEDLWLSLEYNQLDLNRVQILTKYFGTRSDLRELYPKIVYEIYSRTMGYKSCHTGIEENKSDS